ncbi:hypothetical protein Syn7502_00382 [Synechococcus sp. PCC 7502]|uniref:DUF7734 family protein n=1 Tax=Synechococcus sp. PCC 7502 TaxID=1173263 RepID=UPI00029FB5B9|nr:hypothetical protein [Synechococcus sp. PCC 7502]AFY72546.1 hypothetical protein Syn7502_00382 [Synechococcus sp. PCC 7502]
MSSIQKQLEQYTQRRSQEVLLVTLDIDGTTEEVVVFKGFSSCLSRATAYDPDVPVIPENAQIITIDRLQAPYNPSQPNYIERSLTSLEFIFEKH